MTSIIKYQLNCDISKPFDFHKYYDPEKLTSIDNGDYSDLLPTFYRTIFHKLHNNKYNKIIVENYDINKYKFIIMNKKYKNKFIKTHIKNSNYFDLKPIQQIRSLKNLSETYATSHHDFHYYINLLIAENFLKIKNYDKTIEHYLLAKELLIKYENNLSVFRYEQKYKKCDKYICLNSKKVLDISYNIGLIHIYNNKFDEGIEYFIHPYNYHKKSNQILIVLFLKYYYKISHNNVIRLAVHFNQYILAILHTPQDIDVYKEHYIMGFLYYIIHEPPYLYLAIKHLEKSAVFYPNANMLLGNIYCETGYYYNIYKSLTFYNTAKKLDNNINNKLSISLNKMYLQIDIENSKKFNKFNIYFKYLFSHIINNWKYNKENNEENNKKYVLYVNIKPDNYNAVEKYITENNIITYNINIDNIDNVDNIKNLNKLYIYFKYLYSKCICNWIYNIYDISKINNKYDIDNIYMNYIDNIKNLNKLYIYFKYLYSKCICNWIYNNNSFNKNFNNMSNIYYNYSFSEIIRKWRINWLLD